MGCRKQRFKFKDTFDKDMNYTTADIISKIDPKETAALQAEQAKTLITNDAFAVVDMIKALIDKIEHARVSLV